MGRSPCCSNVGLRRVPSSTKEDRERKRMGRSPCCSNVGLRRVPWSTKEDNLLRNFIQENGEGQWRSLPKKAGLLRCGKSCRLRWMNYLRPGIKRGNITEDEEDLIARLHGLLGNRWSLIAGRLPGRTDNEIKNYWNTHLIKKLKSAGINPNPHKDLPKPTKKKKFGTADGGGGAAAGKRKKKQKKVADAEEENEEKLAAGGDAAAAAAEEEPKTKVYRPKPIRMSSVFSRTSKFDSLENGTSSSDGGEAAESYTPWPPLFELGEDGGCGVYAAAGEDDFLDGGFVLPVLQHYSDSSLSGDVNMFEKVYDEYLKLL